MVSNLKRFTVCTLMGHNWLRIGYPAGSDGEASGVFLRCARCSLENHDAGTVARGGIPLL